MIRENCKSKITLSFQVWVIGDLVIMLVNKLNLVLSQALSKVLPRLYLIYTSQHPKFTHLVRAHICLM